MKSKTFLLLYLIASASFSFAQDLLKPKIQDLDLLSAWGISENHLIAGFDEQFGYIEHRDLKLKIAVPDALYTYAYRVNTRGDVVGSFVDSNFRVHGYIYSGGNFTTVDVPDSILPGATRTNLFGINDLGMAVGWAVNDTKLQSFVYYRGSFAALPLPENAAAYGINNLGQVVGNFDCHGFLFTVALFQRLDFPNATCTYAYGLNDLGQVVGAYNGPSGGRGYIRNLLFYSHFDVPGSQTTNILDINNSGEMVGIYLDGRGLHSFLAE